jgi:AraC-like DNA-binding protein
MLLIINIIAIVNFVILGVILFLRSAPKRENRLLAFLLIAPTFALFFNILIYLHLINQFAFVFLFSFFFNFLWGPCFYFYVVFTIGRKKRFDLRDLLHAIPAIAAFCYSLSIVLMPFDERLRFFDGFTTQVPVIQTLFNGVMILQVFFYLILSWVRLRAYNRSLKHLFSYRETISAKWLQEFILLSVGMGLLAFLPEMIFPKLESYLIYLPVCSSFVYVFVVYKSITEPVIFGASVQDIFDEQPDKTNTFAPLRYKDSVLTEHAIGQYADRLVSLLVQKKMYLSPDLNIKILSDEVGITLHQLSEIINRKFNMNFFDFINSYRVEESRRYLINEEYVKFTIETIAEMSGFKSRSAFYTAFKKHTGDVPTTYRKTFSLDN